MLDIPINNPEILQSLNKFLWFYDERNKEISKCRLWCNSKEREHYTGDKHRDSIMSRGSIHNGFPENGNYYSFRTDHENSSKALTTKVIENYTKFNEELQVKLCTRGNGLCAMYPPKGFISWHNNANASAYNLIFTWSETGDGYFKYIDGYTGKEITIQDRKGWQCKAGYFGAYDEEPEKLLYHSASTDCWRITVAYLFNRKEISIGLQEDVIEEIKFK